MNYNARSINKHFNEISLLLDTFTFQPMVIGLTETQVSSQIPFVLQDYNGHNILCKHTTHDSLSIFIHKKIDNYNISQVEFNSFNAAELTFELNGKSFSLLIIYRSPSLDASTFIIELDNYLKYFSKKADFSFILGDININTLVNNKLSDSYLEKLLQQGYLSVINLPTRFESVESSCLDHIMFKISLKSDVKGATLEFHATDHIPTFLELDFPTHKPDISDNYNLPQSIKKEINYPKLIESLALEMWTDVTIQDSPDEALRMFYNTVERLIDENSSNLLVKSSLRKIKPWMTTGILISIRRRDIIYKKYTTHKKLCCKQV